MVLRESRLNRLSPHCSVASELSHQREKGKKIKKKNRGHRSKVSSKGELRYPSAGSRIERDVHV